MDKNFVTCSLCNESVGKDNCRYDNICNKCIVNINNCDMILPTNHVIDSSQFLICDTCYQYSPRARRR